LSQKVFFNPAFFGVNKGVHNIYTNFLINNFTYMLYIVRFHFEIAPAAARADARRAGASAIYLRG
jgi:hypothetical protein